MNDETFVSLSYKLLFGTLIKVSTNKHKHSLLKASRMIHTQPLSLRIIFSSEQ